MCRASVEDYEAIVKAVSTYAEGSAAGNSEAMRPAFHKDAIMYGVNLDGSMAEGSIENLYKMVDDSGPAKGCAAHIDVLDIAGSAAVARVVIENWHGFVFTDYHQLIKVNGQWKIISKIYYTHEEKRRELHGGNPFA